MFSNHSQNKPAGPEKVLQMAPRSLQLAATIVTAFGTLKNHPLPPIPQSGQRPFWPKSACSVIYIYIYIGRCRWEPMGGNGFGNFRAGNSLLGQVREATGGNGFGNFRAAHYHWDRLGRYCGRQLIFPQTAWPL